MYVSLVKDFLKYGQNTSSFNCVNCAAVWNHGSSQGYLNIWTKNFMHSRSTHWVYLSSSLCKIIKIIKFSLSCNSWVFRPYLKTSLVSSELLRIITQEMLSFPAFAVGELSFALTRCWIDTLIQKKLEVKKERGLQSYVYIPSNINIGIGFMFWLKKWVRCAEK